jgi:hypothetical protein
MRLILALIFTKLLADRAARLSERRHQGHTRIEPCCRFLSSSVDDASHTGGFRFR